MIRFLLSTLLYTIIYSTALYAQKGSISGFVTEKATGKPLAYSMFILKDKNGPTILKVTTNSKGYYIFASVKYGTYMLSGSNVGFEGIDEETTISAEKPEVVLNFQLLPTLKALKEVVISSKKPLYANSIDRKVYQVDQDIMSKTGSASDVLQNVPLVQMDIDGNVSLRNSSVTILINGKTSPLMGKNQAAVLQQLPANSIERIEIITNPSAKYKPASGGGIINIVLKKNTKRGLNGSVTANAGIASRYNSGVVLNYHPEKVNIFGSYSYKQDDRKRTTFNTRTQSSNFFADSMQALSRPFSNIATLGIDFIPNEKNTWGIAGNYYLRNMKKHDVTSKILNQSNSYTRYNRQRENSERETEADVTLSYEHSFEKDGHALQVETNISHSPEVEDNHYTNVYFSPQRVDSLENTLIKQTSFDKQINISYNNPINKNTELELGYNGEFNKQDLDFYGEAYIASKDRFAIDLGKTNRFIYNENIHAFYGTIKHSIKKMDFMVGLRAENTSVKSKLITNGTAIPNQYLKFYPTLHLSYKLQKNQEVQINYSRRVHRPEGDDLNPFAEYSDPTNIRVGNPYLKPELLHSVELGYQWKNDVFSILPAVYYKYKYNGFTTVSAPSESNPAVLITTQQNLSNEQSAGADVVFSANVKNKLSTNLSSSIFHNQINASNLGYSSNKSTLTWSANSNSTLTLKEGTHLQLSFNYRSARLTAQGKYQPVFVSNAGLKQEVLKKKASIYFTASDLFKSLKQDAWLNANGLNQRIITRSNSRMLYAGFSYNFGKPDKKKKETLEFDNSL